MPILLTNHCQFKSGVMKYEVDSASSNMYCYPLSKSDREDHHSNMVLYVSVVLQMSICEARTHRERDYSYHSENGFKNRFIALVLSLVLYVLSLIKGKPNRNIYTFLNSPITC